MPTRQEMEGPDSMQDLDARRKTRKKSWKKPEITSITSVLNTQGISYRPLDGISNLT